MHARQGLYQLNYIHSLYTFFRVQWGLRGKDGTYFSISEIVAAKEVPKCALAGLGCEEVSGKQRIWYGMSLSGTQKSSDFAAGLLRTFAKLSVEFQ